MATPLTPTQLLAVVQASGLPYAEIPGWRDRCRCHTGSHERGVGPITNGERDWGPTNGFVIHHTVSNPLTGQAAINYCTNVLNVGRADTPGPLVQLSIDGDGRVIICAAGRSNQAGSISQAALDHMIAADFRTDIPYQDVRGKGVDGNTHTFAVEIQAIGVPSDVQRDAAERLAAAFCHTGYGWTGGEVCGHGEIAAAKAQVDPGLDMGAFRRAVMAIISAATGSGAGGGVPSGNVPPPVPPTPPAPPARPVVRLSHIVVAMALDSAPSSPTGTVHYGDPAGSRAVEQALKNKGFNPGPVDGSLGTMFKAAYAAYQRSLGYSGKDADGIPGMTSLSRLGRETGLFTVVA